MLGGFDSSGRLKQFSASEELKTFIWRPEEPHEDDDDDGIKFQSLNEISSTSLEAACLTLCLQPPAKASGIVRD